MIEIIAHRGASAYEPENTLRAFERAIAMGAGMIELDVHTTLDGELIVLHDPDVSRTTNGAGNVGELTLAEAQRFDAGSGEHLPSLAEVIDLVRGRARLYIELKGVFTAAPLVDLLRRERFTAGVIAGSFLPWLPQKVKWLAPEIKTSLLFGDTDWPRMIAWARSIEADYVHPCWERQDPTPHRLLTPEFLGAARASGMGIVVWHEERPAELTELCKAPVYGICTNTPDLLHEVMKRQTGEEALSQQPG